jgi:hypothetical protein
MSTSIYYSLGLGNWAIVRDDRFMYGSNGSTWLGGYGSTLYRSNGASWVPIWNRPVPTPPAGVTPTCSQEFFFGGDVLADWINSTSSYTIEVQWRINGSTWGSTTVAMGVGQARLPAFNVVTGDTVDCRMRYYEGSFYGTFSAYSNQITYLA